MDFDEGVHAVFVGGGFDFGHLLVREARGDDQDGVGADRAGFEALPRVDHEVFADDRQGAGGAGFDQVILMALEVGRVGEHREARGTSSLIGGGVGGGREIGADQAFGGAGLLDLGDEREGGCGLGAQGGFEAARGCLFARAGGEVCGGGGGLAGGDFGALGVADLGEHVGHCGAAFARCDQFSRVGFWGGGNKGIVRAEIAEIAEKA